ncbi:MAG: trypsin-like serine protease [Ruminococcus flavefaciens]|nr:trypsin-like serine protease [Ruminococcus flavefaciens]
MNKIMIADVKKITAVFIAMIIAVLSLSYTGNRAEALNTSRKYYVYDAETGNRKSEYTLNPVSSINNSRSVIGEDERVIDWTKSGVVKLMSPTYYLGSGFVVSDHVIATAAHCVYNKEIEEILLFDNNGNVTLNATPVEYHVPYSYVNNNSYIYDYALITVKEDLSSYACFDLGVPLDSFANGKSVVSVSGFPQDIGKTGETVVVNTKTEHMKYTGNGIVSDKNDSILFYKADTCGGNSGGPVYITESDNGKTYYTVVAVHTNGGYDENSGIRITTDLIHFYTSNNTNINW